MLLLLCGPSGVGKSTIVEQLALPDDEVLHQDSFFAAPFLSYTDALRLGATHAESPSHIDFESLRKAVSQACERCDGHVIVEGHMLLHDAQLVQMAHQVVLLDASSEACAARRIGRRSRTADENAELELYYQTFVAPANAQYNLPVVAALKHQRPGLLQIVDATQPLNAVLDNCRKCLCPQ